MENGDEPLSLLSNLLAVHWPCDFRNNRRVRRRRLPSLHAQCSQSRTASARYQWKCAATKQKTSYEFSPAATATCNLIGRSGYSAGPLTVASECPFAPRSASSEISSHYSRGSRFFRNACPKLTFRPGSQSFLRIVREDFPT